MAVSCKSNNKNEDSVDAAKNSNEMKAQDSALGTKQSDADFVVKAASGGMAEVNAGKLASQKATAANVKDFGAQMVKDHSKINDQLKKLADSLNITIPTAVDQKQQDAFDKLNAMAARDFDKEYMDMMVKDHNDDVKMFQGAANDISTPGIHNFIIESLPVLQHHRQMAKELYGSLK